MYQAVDNTGNISPIKYLISSPNYKIVLLHECASIIKSFYQFNDIDDIVFVVSFSWHVDDEKGHAFANFVKEMTELFPSKSNTFLNNVIFLANSLSEYNRMKHYMPRSRIIHCNNACFLSESYYTIRERAKEYDAVMNAKPLLFKRHYLAVDVEKLALITYGEETCSKDKNFYDLSRVSPSNIFRSVSEWKISDVLAQAYSGLLLSEVEGACYASCEYLLSGLPVVSTLSLGGRSDFYCQNNSIIVEGDPSAVAHGVKIIKDRVLNGSFNSHLIRQEVIIKIEMFRDRLSEEITKILQISDNSVGVALRSALKSSNKLWDYKNFWISKLDRI